MRERSDRDGKYLRFKHCFMHFAGFGFRLEELRTA